MVIVPPQGADQLYRWRNKPLFRSLCSVAAGQFRKSQRAFGTHSRISIKVRSKVTLVSPYWKYIQITLFNRLVKKELLPNLSCFALQVFGRTNNECASSESFHSEGEITNLIFAVDRAVHA